MFPIARRINGITISDVKQKKNVFFYKSKQLKKNIVQKTFF